MKIENIILGLMYLAMAGILYILGVTSLAIDTFIHKMYSSDEKIVAILITAWLSCLFVWLILMGIYEFTVNDSSSEIYNTQ